MKKNFSLCLLVFSVLFSCQSKNTKYIDIDNLTANFDVAAFFYKKVEATNQLLNSQKMDRKTALSIINDQFIVKDTLALYSPANGLFRKKSLDVTNSAMSRGVRPTEIFGFDYNTRSYKESDTVAILNAVTFPTINMGIDKKGKLIYIMLKKPSSNLKDYQLIMDYLTKNCKKLNIDTNRPNRSYWENHKFYYYLERSEDPKIEISDVYLKIYEKSYVDNMKRLDIHSPGSRFWEK